MRVLSFCLPFSLFWLWAIAANSRDQLLVRLGFGQHGTADERAKEIAGLHVLFGVTVVFYLICAGDVLTGTWQLFLVLLASLLPFVALGKPKP